MIPDDASTIAQELFVFALGGDGRHELQRVVASDYSRAQINVKLQSMSSDLVLRHVEDADRMATEAFAGTGITVLTTGSGKLFSTLDHYLVESQVSSFGTAFLTVFGVIFIVFRSWRFGALTIVPNVLPVLAVLGVMGYLDISMNIATVMVASVALGVVDDDTIHFINRYRREVSEGATTDEAIEQATIHEGRASLTTAIINSVGYAVLFLSEYKPTAWFGGLLALTMAVAFLAEVFILPPIIKLMPRIFGADALRRGRQATATAALVLRVSRRLRGGVGGAGADRPAAPDRQRFGAGQLVPECGESDVTEIRGRIFAEQKINPSDNWTFTLAGFAEGLAGRSETAIARVHEATTSFRVGHFDLYAGYGRVVWGRLDELQPTDVINPLDISKFFFEGRSEARLPVALVRGRWHFTDAVSIEGVYVPFFRRGRFDQLDEPSSPFNIVPPFTNGDVTCQAIGCPPIEIPVERLEPSATWATRRVAPVSMRHRGPWTGVSRRTAVLNRSVFIASSWEPRFRRSQFRSHSSSKAFPALRSSAAISKRWRGSGGFGEKWPRSCATTSRARPPARLRDPRSTPESVSTARPAITASAERFSITVKMPRAPAAPCAPAAPWSTLNDTTSRSSSPLIEPLPRSDIRSARSASITRQRRRRSCAESSPRSCRTMWRWRHPEAGLPGMAATRSVALPTVISSTRG